MDYKTHTFFVYLYTKAVFILREKKTTLNVHSEFSLIYSGLYQLFCSASLLIPLLFPLLMGDSVVHVSGAGGVSSTVGS